MKLIPIVLFLLAANISVAYSTDFLPIPTNNLVRHTYYTLSFNKKYEDANWVYYTLTDSMVLNSGEKRSNRFKMDNLGFTLSAKPSDYTKSGYDRGHLCPAADMEFNPIAVKECFLMSNITPQVHDFNSGIWEELEKTVRKWAVQEHKLYIVTGPIFKDDKGTIGKDHVEVPGYFYKIIYDETDGPKMIAFVFPNEKSDRPLTDFAVTVDETEKLTGYDFFSQLPDGQENKLESQVQLAGWFAGYVQETPIAQNAKTKTVHNDIYFYLILISIILLVALIIYLISRRRRRR